MENKLLTITLVGVLVVIIGAVIFQISKQPADSVSDDEEQFSNVNVSSEWKQYENNVFGFSLAYPETFYLSGQIGEGGVLSISALSSDDPKSASDIGLASTLRILVLDEGRDAYVQRIRENILNEDVVLSNVAFNDGSIAQEVFYKNPFGVQIKEIFIETAQGETIMMSFWSETDHSAIFEEIMQSFTNLKP